MSTMDRDWKIVLALLIVTVTAFSQAQLCEKSCPYGFAVDSNGNSTCNCSQQTVIHSGECPVASEGSFGICAEMCAHDGECSDNQKCCSNGCGHTCAEAVHPDKEGSCPAVQGDVFGSCVEACNHDNGCPGAQKCCSNGCGHTCAEPDNGSTDYRDGVCPLGALPNGTMGACAELCSSDVECPSHHKCCSNGCGHVCIMANSLPVIHAGTCPAVDPDSFGTCSELCGNDGECAGNEKCCSNGCGHQCTAAEIEPVCLPVMCTLWCSHGFKQDSDGCNICACNPQTEIHAGECPVVVADQVGICVETCDHDGSCSTNQKCCSNGCGHTCVDAVVAAVEKPGTCPAVANGTVGLCADLCSGDGECSGTQKCCSNGCGHVCTEADDVIVHNGTCPVGLLPEGNSGICSEMCSDDGDCSPSQKCCSNGCGHVCITTTTPNEENCPDIICRLFCSYGNEYDSNGCKMCSCLSAPGEHPGSCPVGLLPEGAVGICLEACSGDLECQGNEKCCSNGCGHECVEITPSNATVTCPDMMCLMWCEHGYRKDQYGCNTCYCNEMPEHCPDVMCMMYCPYGNVEDESGCPICRCKDAPDQCPDIICNMYCEHGFQRDTKGCEICVCSEPSEIRPGSCPGDFESTVQFGTCVNMCDNDIECSTNQKCCSNGCGYTCVDAVDLPSKCPDFICALYCPYGNKKDRNGCDICECNPQTTIHDGDCPATSVPSGMIGLCAEMCQQDGNCSTNQKCCSNGCGHTCVEAIQSGTVKDGKCAAPIESQDGICVNLCENDSTCPANQKCCSNGCGRACAEPEPEVVRPGTCPVGLLPEGEFGACYEGCHDDGDCSTNQKCCSNGCGHTCITVIEEPETCQDVMCMMFCEYGFVRDANGCDTCVCNDAPSSHKGSCPANSVNNVFGTCVESCYRDSDCSANEKCCSNGCGHTCQTAVDVPVEHPGTCPVGFLPEGVSGVCAELCQDDGACSANQKCCSNGCGHVCVQVAPDCSNRVMCAMYCENGYVTDEDGCDTCACLELNAAPTPKPGMCPIIVVYLRLPLTADACVYECENDATCFGNQLCCPVGCGMRCMDPVPEPNEQPPAGAAAGLASTLYLTVLLLCLSVVNQF